MNTIPPKVKERPKKFRKYIYLFKPLLNTSKWPRKIFWVGAASSIDAGTVYYIRNCFRKKIFYKEGDEIKKEKKKPFVDNKQKMVNGTPLRVIKNLNISCMVLKKKKENSKKENSS